MIQQLLIGVDAQHRVGVPYVQYHEHANASVKKGSSATPLSSVVCPGQVAVNRKFRTLKAVGSGQWAPRILPTAHCLFDCPGNQWGMAFGRGDYGKVEAAEDLTLLGFDLHLPLSRRKLRLA